MTPKQNLILKKLGIDANQPEEDILNNLINLCEWLYNETEKTEKERFSQELKRVTQTPTN